MTIEDRLHVKISDKNQQVYQVPESVFTRPQSDGVDSGDASLKFSYKEQPFSFTVSRASSGEVIFDTSAASLVFESQYLRLRTKLPTDPNIYGLGESTDSFRLSTVNYTRTLWNADNYLVPNGQNLYGSHPVYTEHRSSGSHGVLFLNSNGMDVVINQESSQQYLEYNTLGGVLDFYFMNGPSPVDVAKQYSEVAGLPALAPYAGLGLHQCRWGYQDAWELANVVSKYKNASIPLETMWADIDYMQLRRVSLRSFIHPCGGCRAATNIIGGRFSP